MMGNVIVCGLWPRGCCIYDPVQFYYWEKGGGRASLTCVKQMGAITVISFIEKKKIQEQSNRVHNIRNPRPLLLLHRIAQRVNQKCDYESHMGVGYRGTEFHDV